jgi:hypothetical protein
MRELLHFLFGVRFDAHRNRLGRRLPQHCGGFFHQIKVRQQIGRKGSIQAACLRQTRLESFLYYAAKNFELFLKIQNAKLKHIALDVLS